MPTLPLDANVTRGVLALKSSVAVEKARFSSTPISQFAGSLSSLKPIAGVTPLSLTMSGFEPGELKLRPSTTNLASGFALSIPTLPELFTTKRVPPNSTLPSTSSRLVGLLVPMPTQPSHPSVAVETRNFSLPFSESVNRSSTANLKVFGPSFTSSNEIDGTVPSISTPVLPLTCRFAAGLLVPMPTSPSDWTRIFSLPFTESVNRSSTANLQVLASFKSSSDSDGLLPSTMIPVLPLTSRFAAGLFVPMPTLFMPGRVTRFPPEWSQWVAPSSPASDLPA